jgi:hypothetical protein
MNGPMRVAYLAAGRQVGVRVGVGREAGEHEGADDPAAAVERDDQPRAQALPHPGLVGVGLREAGVGREVVDPHRLAGEDVADRPFGHHVPTGGVERRGVVLLVQRQVGGGVLGEDGEGPSVVVQVVEDQAVMGHQPLDLRRELRQEALRVELLLHRAAEGGQRGHQVGERGLRLHDPRSYARHPTRQTAGPLTPLRRKPPPEIVRPAGPASFRRDWP